MEKKKKIDWKKVGYIGLSVIGFLVLIFLLNLNFGPGIALFVDGLKSVVIPAGIALFLVYLTKPLYIAFLRKIKRKNPSAFLTVLITFMVIAGLFALLISLLIIQARDIINQINTNWSAIDGYLKQFINDDVYAQITTEAGTLDPDGVKDFLSENVGLINIFSQATNGVIAVVYWIIILVMMPVFYFFFLRDGEIIFEKLMYLLPRSWHKKQIKDIMLLSNKSTGQYMKGKIISIGFISAIFSVGFGTTLAIYMVFLETPGSWWMGLLYGILFGCLLGIFDLIPYIGPTIGVLLPVTYMVVAGLAIDPIVMVIFIAILIVVNFAGQELQKILIEPMIMSKEVKVHPLLVLSGLMFFGTLFGFVGFILATPIVATIQNSIYYFKELKGSDPEEELEMLEKIKQERELLMNISSNKKSEVKVEEIKKEDVQEEPKKDNIE